MPYYYSTDNPSMIGQRVLEEIKTGISHKNLIGDSGEIVEIGDVNWRNLQQGGKATPGAYGQIAIDNYTSACMKMLAKNNDKPTHNESKEAHTFIKIGKDEQTLNKNPDLYEDVLRKTEILTGYKLDKTQGNAKGY